LNWINNFVRPKIRSLLTQKREMPDGQWITCPESGQMVFYKDLEANQFVVPGSGYHWRMSARQRLSHTFAGAEYKLVPVPGVPVDPLKFRDTRRYVDRLKDARAANEQDDAVLVAEGKLDGLPVVVAAQDFTFMAGSLGMAAGEAIVVGMLRAAELGQPFILFAASGGARMQEGILSLMQMPRTTIAVQRLREARLPYVVVLTDPTSGGVTASYAMLGDIHIAEPNALICFAGPRVIQQTIREQLPDGFQRSEYLLAHGMVDMVVHRHRLRATLTRVCRLLMAGVDHARERGASAPAQVAPTHDGAARPDAPPLSDGAAKPTVTRGAKAGNGKARTARAPDPASGPLLLDPPPARNGADGPHHTGGAVNGGAGALPHVNGGGVGDAAAPSATDAATSPAGHGDPPATPTPPTPTPPTPTLATPTPATDARSRP
jgi:acetyl-CoA carboxylase carboxyl transferase subunit beta